MNPFMNYVLDLLKTHPATYGANGFTTPERAMLFALAGLAERDLNTPNSVPLGYTETAVAHYVGLAPSTTKRYLNALERRGYVQRVHGRAYRPNEA